MIEQYNIISSTAAGGVPTSTAKIETPEEKMSKVEHPHVFAMRLVSKHFGLCQKVRGAAMCERITIPNAMMDDIAARDTAIRSECAELLKMCGEALEQIASDDYMFSIHEIARVALAALGEAGVNNGNN